MLTETNLRELVDFNASDPVLTVYLNTEPTEGNADTHKLHLRNMFKGIHLPKDEKALELYFDHEYSWTGRGVAVFSCAPRGFFRAYPLGIPVYNQVHVGDRPSVKPLTDLIDVYGGYGVVLVDKQGARLFFFHLGELREQEGVLGEIVKHTKQGGASTFPGRRGGTAGQTHYEDELVDRNMKDTVDYTVHFFEENRVRRILIGGSEDNVAMFRGMLPKTWQSLVMGSFPMSMTVAHPEVLAKVMQVGMEAEKRQETRLVEALITSAAKGNEAVVGLENTLTAINDNRVQSLFVAQGFRKAGYRCQNCDYITFRSMESCPVCEGKMEPTDDVVEMAISKVMRHGGNIEIVHDNVQFEKIGEIGAMLRY